MRIVHIADEIWDSGLTNYALTLARAQKNCGEQVYFIAREKSHALKICAELNIPAISFRNMVLDFIPVLSALKKIRPQVINAHTGSAQSYGFLLKKMLGNTALVRTRADARAVKVGFLSGALWNNTDGFIAANSKILARFRTLREITPSELILQGVSAPPLLRAKNFDLCSAGIIGRLDPVKGHKTAIKAAALIRQKLPSFVLKIAGEEKNVKAIELSALARELGISDAVQLKGFVPDGFAFMDECALGIISSEGSEAVSRVAIEFMARGIPVIATDVGGLSDIVENGKTGILIPPADAKAMAETAIFLLGNKTLLEEMGKAGRARYEALFTPQKFYEKTKLFYERIRKK
ncbi:MAG: glycosyltransferase family 4 protein [Elusimicrobia bacterium]|nr:glycosyltransferase family 4 protein [Elusimicrobiota bacterium]